MSQDTAGPSRQSVRPKDTQAPARTRKRKKKRGKVLTLDIPTADGDHGAPGADTARVVATVRRFGYTDHEMATAVHKLREIDEAVTFDSLIDMSLSVQRESLEQEVLEGRGRLREQPKCHVTNDDAESDDADAEDDDHTSGDDDDVTPTNEEDAMNLKLKKAIENRKSELRAAISSLTFMCRLCNCSRATILLLPCGHLASCDDCLMDVRRCPVARCNKVVRGTKEVFFV